MSVIGIAFLYQYFYNPATLHEHTTFHALFIALLGAILALVLGSFAGYHIYLILTNQTTIEQISFYHLLAHLPIIPAASGHDIVYPPKEHQLTYSQRRLVREAHSKIRVYNVGYQQNYQQVFTSSSLWHRLWFGGNPSGDGYSFPRNPEAPNQLASLASALRSQEDDL